VSRGWAGRGGASTGGAGGGGRGCRRPVCFNFWFFFYGLGGSLVVGVLGCARAGRSVAVRERLTAGSQASGRAAGLFKSVQADELRTRLARRSIVLAVTFADWAGVPLPVS